MRLLVSVNLSPTNRTIELSNSSNQLRLCKSAFCSFAESFCNPVASCVYTVIKFFLKPDRTSSIVVVGVVRIFAIRSDESVAVCFVCSLLHFVSPKSKGGVAAPFDVMPQVDHSLQRCSGSPQPCTFVGSSSQAHVPERTAHQSHRTCGCHNEPSHHR